MEQLRFELDGTLIGISFESLFYVMRDAPMGFYHNCRPYDISDNILQKWSSSAEVSWAETIDRLHRLIEEKLEELFTHELHGSGWDGDWSVDRCEHGFDATIDYHHMNEDGYYDGWTKFTLHLDQNLNIIEIENDADEETVETYLWDEYHEEALYFAVEAVKMRLAKDTLLAFHVH